MTKRPVPPPGSARGDAAADQAADGGERPKSQRRRLLTARAREAGLPWLQEVGFLTVTRHDAGNCLDMAHLALAIAPAAQAAIRSFEMILHQVISKDSAAPFAEPSLIAALAVLLLVKGTEPAASAQSQF